MKKILILSIASALLTTGAFAQSAATSAPAGTVPSANGTTAEPTMGTKSSTTRKSVTPSSETTTTQERMEESVDRSSPSIVGPETASDASTVTPNDSSSTQTR